MARGPRISHEVACRIIEAIASKRLVQRELTEQLWAAIEAVTENPDLGTTDRAGLFRGARIYTFTIDPAPLFFRGTLAYRVLDIDGESWVELLDFVWR